jgi:aminoglycoside 3-N-acetyltransferase
MKKSLLTRLGIIFKHITGIKDISMMRKKLHKDFGRLIYHKKYEAEDIINIMKDFGMKAGSVICIHAAMKEFYNYKGSAEELIHKIQDVITPEGTLIMPAFPDPKDQIDSNYIFDPINDKTKAGYLAETFRKLDGVKRSINVQHSVCAWGKHAEWLTKDHFRCSNCWDENSPWYRMTTLGALVFTLGMPSNYIGTFDHCVEATLYKEHPYWAQFFNIKRTYHYYDEDKNIHQYISLTGNIDCRTRERKLTKYFNDDIFKKRKLSNLLIKVFLSKPCLDKMIELGRKGITMYYVPSTKKFKF